MKNPFIIILIILTWAFSAINTSGWGLLYDTPSKTNIIICIWLFILILERDIDFNSYFTLTILSIISFIIVPFFISGTWDGFMYAMMAPLVYCFSQQKIEAGELNHPGYIVASLGIIVLLIYKYTNILSGWNDNQIAMIGLFSYVFYTIPLFGQFSNKNIYLNILISLIYFLLLTTSTESRSSCFFIVISFICLWQYENVKKLLFQKYFIPIILSIPLFIAVFAVLFPNNLLMQSFNDWSLENYGKTGLNGRYELWQRTFENLPKNFYLGDGKFKINHHNSAMAILGCFGVVAYICWFIIFEKCLRHLISYIEDDESNIIDGCLMAFLIIYLQQSFELGFVTPTPNMIPYTILGIGLARANTVSIYGQNKYYYTSF